MVKIWKSTLLGYGLVLLLSLLATFTFYTTSQLANTGINAPGSQCLLYYLLLALVNGGLMLYRREPLQVQDKCYYLMLALVDLLVKNFVIEAIRYTSLTSVMLLDYWTMTCSMLLSWLFFNKKYGLQIRVGLAISIASYAMVFISDLHSTHGINSRATNLLKGDTLIIVGTTLSVVSSVIQGFMISIEDDWVKRRAFLGIFGAILSALQIAIFERNEFRFILSSSMAVCLVIGFSLSKYFHYLGTHFSYQIFGLTMQNPFAFITYNIWVVLIRIFVYHEKVDWIYFVALAAAALGLIFIVFPGNGEPQIDDPNNGEPQIPIPQIDDPKGEPQIPQIVPQIDDPNNNGEPPQIDDGEVNLGHSNNVVITNRDRHKIFSLRCYMSCIIGIQRGDVRE